MTTNERSEAKIHSKVMKWKKLVTILSHTEKYTLYRIIDNFPRIYFLK